MKKWDFQMKGERSAEVYLYEEIGRMFGGLTSKSFAEELNALGAVDEITLRINSMGGSVFDGFTIHSLLKNHAAKVTVKVDGIAASIASLIAMAGDEIQISENGFFMIHEPWTIISGTAKELREEADTLDKFQSQGNQAYASRSGLPESEILAMMADGKETWLNATESVSKGFANSIIQPSRAAALTIDRNLFPNAPSQLKHRPISGDAKGDLDKAKAESEAKAVAVRMRLLDIQDASA
jgi:ATP-dependent protease ClpP protease subunit